MRRPNADRLLRRIRGINGWFWPAAGYLLCWLDEIQKNLGIRGNIFEIGAYHGKSAALLAHLLVRPHESLGVCDLFGDPDPGSNGVVGFRAAFERNMRRFTAAPDEIRIVQRDAADLTVQDTGAPCRIFHIDGGHSAEHVYDDLHTADRSLHPQGIVVLDDFHNFAWPGVAEGFFRFMADRPGVFAPVAAGFNKGILIRPDARDVYLRTLDDPAERWRAMPRGPFDVKTIELCGVETRLFHAPSVRSPDLQRSILTLIHQHHPRWADVIARWTRFHRRRPGIA